MDLREKYKSGDYAFELVRKEKIKVFNGDMECLNLPGCISRRLNCDGVIFRTRITADTIYIRARNDELTSKLIEKCDNAEWIDFDNISRVNKSSPLYGKNLKLYVGDFAAAKKKHPRLSKDYKLHIIKFENHDVAVYIHEKPEGLVYLSKSLQKEKWFSITLFMKENGIKQKIKKAVNCDNLFIAKPKPKKSSSNSTKMWGPKSNARGYKIPGARGGAKLWS